MNIKFPSEENDISQEAFFQIVHDKSINDNVPFRGKGFKFDNFVGKPFMNI